MLSRYILLLLFFIFSIRLKAQVFWTETFDNGCTSGCDISFYSGANGAWTDDTLLSTNDPQANRWYVSCAENGHTSGECGTGCVPASATATLASLHIGANDSLTPIDAGASYDAGGLCGFGICVITDKRAESPTIDCTGKTSITLAFDYIERGQANKDYASVWYYDGAIWTSLVSPLPTTVVAAPCKPQGTWTAYSIVLPASADNNPNIKIGFRWVNNDDGVGKDPSIAIDNVTLSTAIVTPIRLVDFSGVCHNNIITLNWATASETNNNYFSINRTTDGINWQLAGKVSGAGNSSEMKNYSFTDINSTSEIPIYYRLSQTDFDGTTSFLNEIEVSCDDNGTKNVFIYPNPSSGNFELEFTNGMEKTVQAIDVYTILGQTVFYQALGDNIKAFETIDLSAYSEGIYFLEIQTLRGIITKKIMIN